MANELIVTNAAALAALVDKTTGDSLTAAEYTTVKDALQEANTATRTAKVIMARANHILSNSALQYRDWKNWV